MKKKIIIVLISMITTSLFLTTQQNSNAVTYTSYDDSDDKYITKVKVES